MTDKKAYPNFDDYIAQSHPYNIEKWTTAVRDIYSRMQYGLSQREAFNAVTGKWNTVEVRNFQHWLRFYEEQAHMKYKTANTSYYENERQPGYFLPVRRDVPTPIMPPTPDTKMLQDMNDAREQAKVSEEEKRRLVELQRRKIIGRLHSARKLLTDDKGKMFAGEQWTKLMDALNELEKQFHTVNVMRTSSPIYADIIIRKANALASKGMEAPSKFILTLAQGLPGSVPAPDPNASIPDGGALGNNTPPIAKDDRTGIEKVLDAFNGDLGDNSEEDELDELESLDKELDDLESSDGEFEIELPNDADDAELVVEAQMAPAPLSASDPAPAPKPAPEMAPEPTLDAEKPVKGDKPLEVTDKEPVAQGKDFDSLIDAAFSNLKVADIVNRLEELSRIFKNREIARQLSIVDMMMDRLGLSSFFPSLAEATRSALESNQYCLTRIDEVKSRLSGAMNAGGKSLHDMGEQHSINNQIKDTTLEKEPPAPSQDPLLNKVQQNLQSQQERDKLKKELRKKEEEKDLLEGAKEKPQVEGVEQELGGKPAPAPAAAPAPAPKING